jgi:hypothetical protein
MFDIQIFSLFISFPASSPGILTCGSAAILEGGASDYHSSEDARSESEYLEYV